MTFEIIINYKNIKNKKFYIDFNQKGKKFFKIWIYNEKNDCKFFKFKKEKKEFVENRFYDFNNFSEFLKVFFDKIPVEKIFNF